MKTNYTNEELSSMLTNKDVRIRLYWPIFWVLELLYSSFKAWYEIRNNLIHHQTSPQIIETATLCYITVFILLIIALYNYALFDCAYRKHGTKFLGFILLLTLIHFGCVLTNVMHTLGSPPKLDLSKYDLVVFIFSLINTYLSLKLYCINKTIQLKGYLLFSENYPHDLQLLRASQTRDELDKHYQNAYDRLPKRCSAALFVEYMAQRARFNPQDTVVS